MPSASDYSPFSPKGRGIPHHKLAIRRADRTRGGTQMMNDFRQGFVVNLVTGPAGLVCQIGILNIGRSETDIQTTDT